VKGASVESQLLLRMDQGGTSIERIISQGEVMLPGNPSPDLSIYRHAFPLTLFLGIVYGIIFTVGLVGNTLVVFVVIRSPRFRSSVTYLFIVNLAVADLLVILFCLPPTLVSNILVRKSHLNFTDATTGLFFKSSKCCQNVKLLYRLYFRLPKRFYYFLLNECFMLNDVSSSHFLFI